MQLWDRTVPCQFKRKVFSPQRPASRRRIAGLHPKPGTGERLMLLASPPPPPGTLYGNSLSCPQHQQQTPHTQGGEEREEREKDEGRRVIHVEDNTILQINRSQLELCAGYAEGRVEGAQSAIDQQSELTPPPTHHRASGPRSALRSRVPALPEALAEASSDEDVLSDGRISLDSVRVGCSVKGEIKAQDQSHRRSDLGFAH
ncbi:unnamed protein product [Lota lota]